MTSPPGAASGSGPRPWPFVPVLLLLLALADLRVELQLIADHFTFTTLAAAFRTHLLAMCVLLLQPSLWKHYRQRRSSRDLPLRHRPEGPAVSARPSDP